MVKPAGSQKGSKIPVLSLIKKRSAVKKMSYLATRKVINIDECKPFTMFDKLSPSRAPPLKPSPIVAPFSKFLNRNSKPQLTNFCDVGVAAFTPKKTRSGKFFGRKSIFFPKTATPARHVMFSSPIEPLPHPVVTSTPVRRMGGTPLRPPTLPFLEGIYPEEIDLEELNKTNEDVPDLFAIEDPTPLIDFTEDLRKSLSPEAADGECSLTAGRCSLDDDNKENRWPSACEKENKDLDSAVKGETEDDREYQKLMNKVWATAPGCNESFLNPVRVFSNFSGFKPAFTDSPVTIGRRKSSLQRTPLVLEDGICTEDGEQMSKKIRTSEPDYTSYADSESLNRRSLPFSKVSGVPSQETDVAKIADEIPMSFEDCRGVEEITKVVELVQVSGRSPRANENTDSDPAPPPLASIPEEISEAVLKKGDDHAKEAVSADDVKTENVSKPNAVVEALVGKKRGRKPKKSKTRPLPQLHEQKEQKMDDEMEKSPPRLHARRSTRLSVYHRSTNGVEDDATVNLLSDPGDEEKQERQIRNKRRNSIFPRDLLQQIAMEPQDVSSPESSLGKDGFVDFVPQTPEISVNVEEEKETDIPLIPNEVATVDILPVNSRRKSKKNSPKKNKKKDKSPVPIPVKICNTSTEQDNEPIVSCPNRYEVEGRTMVSMVLPKDKNGKRKKVAGIPQIIEIDPTLLVDPPASIIKLNSEGNYSYKKYFRWADTKEEAPLEVVKEFTNEHQDYTLRKSTLKKTLYGS